MLIDVHAHLCDEKLKEFKKEIISDSLNDLPSRIIDTGSSMETSICAYENAVSNERIFCAVGVHPEFADKVKSDDYDRLSLMWQNEKTVAIGEIGLDYHYENNPPREIQKRVFCEQLELAYSLKAPAVIHIRDAFGDAYSLMEENSSKLYYGTLIHCYGGSKEMSMRFNKFDSYYSFGGVITFKNAKEKPDIIRNIPLNRLLIETDCPYMTPEPYRGRMNFPKHVKLVAKRLAEIIGRQQEETEDITAENAFRLFGKLK